MSNFPQNYDDDTTLPVVNDNLTEIGGEAINALRDAVFNIEQNIGLGAAGTTPSIAARLGLLINPDGTPNTSTITSLGLVTLPITNSQIIDNAGIPESKLHLDYRTLDLFNYIRDLSKDVNLALGWISVSGVKLEPHLIGAIYRHDLSQIDVAETSSQFLNNVFRVLRNNTNSYTLINDINSELLAHQWADGSPFGNIQNIITNNGSVYPSDYAHTASGIFLNTSRFAVIPQTNNDLQQFADYIDANSIFLLGTRVQNLYSNGISRNSQSSSLISDGYGQPLVPVTPVIAYLRGQNGNQSIPVDDIQYGDDIIQFMPTNNSSNLFDEQFTMVRAGDIITINYANDGYGIEIQYLIREKKYVPGSTYVVRIAGKNFAYSPNAVARIDRTLFNNNKYGVLATASGVPINSSGNSLTGVTPSLIISSPRGAQVTGIGFTADEFDENHYLLYLALYPNGNPLDGYTVLPAIDVTGNGGTTPGSYTLESIVEATNQAFRAPGFNYRFTAFSYEGEFGVMLADSYNNASFSVISAIVDGAGNYNQTLTEIFFQNNIVDLFPKVSTITSAGYTLPVTSITVDDSAGFSSSGNLSIITAASGIQTIAYTGISGNTFTGCSGGTGTVLIGALVTQPLTNTAAPDPLGFGPYGGNIASPQFQKSYGSPIAAENATKIFVPLRRNNYYVNGIENERLPLDVGQALDTYGDGYWVATIDGYNAVSGPPGYVNVSYLIPLDLSSSGLKAGKTLVVQPIDGYSSGVNYGRFVISSVTFTCCPPVQTVITVYDGVHAAGASPVPVAPVGTQVAIYFNTDSVSFNNETATDNGVVTAPFRRYFEIYIDQNGKTFTQERGRFSISGSPIVNGVTLYNTLSCASLMDIVTISPKLRGYQFGSVNKINLSITLLDSFIGNFSGYLSSYDGSNFTYLGPVITGKVGEVTRFYDVTQTDYIDIIINFSNTLSDIVSHQFIDIQLLPTLELDENVMLLSTCQVDESTNNVTHIIDRREFGNTSEEQFTTSAINFISAPDRLLHFNGVVRGFDISSSINQYLTITGGLAMVNGTLTYLENQTITVPTISETPNYPINFALCIKFTDGNNGEFVLHPITDFDAVLVTPGSGDRIMSVTNKATGVSYNVDSNLFSDILNLRKDLTPLYIVGSTVTGGGLGAAVSLGPIRDVRRFINDSDASIPAVLTTATSQGNFRNLAAALNWIKFNNTFQNTLQVKGAYSTSTDPGLNFPLTIEATGASASMSFNITGAFSISDASFIGLTVTFNPSTSLTLTSCSFSTANITIPSNGAVFHNVTVSNSVVNINGLINPTGVNSFVDCVINVSVQQAFIITSGLSFENCVFNYTFNAAVSGIGYTSVGDLVNASSGLMYASVTTQLNDFTVQGCTFNYSFADHFPMISLQLGGSGSPSFAYTAICHNINISNNQFTCLPIIDDRRAVISIVSTITTPASSPTYPPFPKLVNCSISDNICSHDQLILISATRNLGTAFTGSLLACVDVEIRDNVCGAIGFMTAADFTSNDFNNVAGNIGAIRDKSDQLTIIENNCKLIANLDSKGQFVAFYDPTGSAVSVGDYNWVKIGTGAVAIIRNTCNWISAGQAFWSSGNTSYTGVNGDGIIISQNRLTPGNIANLPFYQDTSNSGIIPPSNGIHLRVGYSQQLDFLAVQGLIVNNILTGKVLLQPNAIFDAYNYNIGIRCDASATIMGNIIRGVGGSPGMIALGGDSNGGPTIYCNNNTLIRGTSTISGYVSSIFSNGTNKVVVTNNIFDQPTIDGSNTAVANNFPVPWVFYQNINQSSNMVVTLPDTKFYLPNTDGIFTGGGPSGVAGRTTTGPAYGATTIHEDSNMRVGRIISQSPWQAGSNYIYVQSPPNSPGASPTQNNISFTVPLDTYLPHNVTILNVGVGIFLRVLAGTGLNTGLGASSVPFNMCTLNLIVSCNNASAGASPHGILDVASNIFFGGGTFSQDDTICLRNAFTIGVANSDFSSSGYNQVQQTEITTATQYASITPTATLVTGQGYKLHLEVSLGWQIADTSSQVAWYLSPILVNYRW